MTAIANNLPAGFYLHAVNYYTERVLQAPDKSMPPMEEQIAWLNKEFPEADWIACERNTISPKFKSPELETFFRLKWS